MEGKEQIIRFVETSLDGSKKLGEAITQIKGVSFMFGNAVLKVSGFGNKKLNELSEKEMEKLEDIILNPSKYNIPQWMHNRRREPKTNKTKHLTVSQLDFTHRGDLNELKKAKSYRGVRHILGLPVRGQRTRSSFRKGKTVGVKRKVVVKPGVGAEKKK